MGLLAVPIIALRNEKGSYNPPETVTPRMKIIALRNEKGSYNMIKARCMALVIIALRNEKGSYNEQGMVQSNH